MYFATVTALPTIRLQTGFDKPSSQAAPDSSFISPYPQTLRFSGQNGFLKTALYLLLGLTGLMATACTQNTADKNRPNPKTEAEFIKQDIHQDMGLTGKGIGIEIIDASEGHLKTVRGIIDDTQQGLSPGVSIHANEEEVKTWDKLNREAKEEKAPWPIHVTDPEELQTLNNTLAKILQKKKLDNGVPIRLINLSIAKSKTSYQKALFRNFKRNGLELSRLLFGKPDLQRLKNMPRTLLQQKVIDVVEYHVKHDTRFQAELKRYQDITEQLAEAGIIVVAAAGNDHLNAGGLQLPSDTDISFFTMSDHVISVAAASRAGSIDNYADDTIFGFSSRGDGRFNPTITAVGQNDTGDEDGTSFAAPHITAYIATMLEKNPGLSFQEIKSLLQKAAIDTEAAPEAEGAGMIDPVRLLRMTPQAASVFNIFQSDPPKPVTIYKEFIRRLDAGEPFTRFEAQHETVLLNMAVRTRYTRQNKNFKDYDDQDKQAYQQYITAKKQIRTPSKAEAEEQSLQAFRDYEAARGLHLRIFLRAEKLLKED